MTAPTTIVFEGEQTIRTVAAAADRLKDGLAGGGAVEIDCRAVTEADLTFVQVLLAARKASARRGIGLALAAPADGPLLACLKSGGFLSSEAGFWMRKDDADV
ncbi:MAG: STAS domain-containing protein [Pseudomonadota bacterium]